MKRFSVIGLVVTKCYVFASHVKLVTSVHDVDNLSDLEPEQCFKCVRLKPTPVGF